MQERLSLKIFGIYRKWFSKRRRIFTRKLYIFLTDSNLPLNRKNIDKGKNNFGKLLINLCKGQNLFIMNGRVGSDSNIGELTCRNASAVDYFICSSNFIKCIDDLTTWF